MDNTVISSYVLLLLAVAVFVVIIIGFKPDSAQPPLVVNLTDDFAPADGHSLYETLQRKTGSVESLGYVLVDSTLDDRNTYLIRGRLGKVMLDKPDSSAGKDYDWVYFDRINNVAIARCSDNLCNKHDLDLFTVDYDEYYKKDPFEWQQLFKDESYLEDGQIGSHLVKVFDAKTMDGRPAKIWVQEFYGVPLKFEFETDEGMRTIEFKEFRINNIRAGEIMLPINMTVDEKEYVFGWYGYLAEEYDDTLR